MKGWVTLVSEAEHCRAVVRSILSSSQPPVVGLDYRGVDFHSKARGHLCLLTLATPDGKCYLFDLKKQALEMMTEGELSRILVAKEMTKVIHNCSALSVVLWHQFRLELANVYDSQMAYFTLLSSLGLPQRYTTLEDMCKKLGATQSLYTTASLEKLLAEDKNFWARRPLTDHVIRYCSSRARVLQQDVKHLLDSVGKQTVQQAQFEDLCQEQLLQGARPATVRRKQRHRQRELQKNVENPRGEAPRLSLRSLERMLLSNTQHIGIL